MIWTQPCIITTHLSINHDSWRLHNSMYLILFSLSFFRSTLTVPLYSLIFRSFHPFLAFSFILSFIIQLFLRNVPSSFIVCLLKHATSQTRVHSRKDVWKDRTAACYQSFAKQIWFNTLLESIAYLGISLGSTESKGIGLMDGSEERSVCHLSYRFLSTFPIHSRYLHLSQLLFGRSTQY